jgi:hypothetical protein
MLRKALAPTLAGLRFASGERDCGARPDRRRVTITARSACDTKRFATT